jgi:hypothetical protein
LALKSKIAFFLTIVVLAVVGYGIGASTTQGEPSQISPPRVTPEARTAEASEQPPITGTICDVPGQRLRSGESVLMLGKVNIQLPDAPSSDYVVTPVLDEIQGTLIGVCSVQLNSAVILHIDGTELKRTVNKEEASSVLDEIVSAVSVER